MESKLKDMPLFVDQEGLLRATGRLQHSNASYSERHPIVLPKEHRYCRLIVLQEHQRLLHAGVHDTLVQLRERYWIISGRQLVRRVIKECVICQRYNSRPASEVTAPLPLDRVTKANPFEVTGIDFAGPLFVKGKPNSQKAYITLFTCAVTRAVHLELVEDMTATSFLHAFRRFISKRGIPQIIYTDNALTFKRSKKELRKLWNIIRDEEVTNQVSSFKIHWKFIVERAPWWGGFYERLVRSVKLSLKKALGCRSLTSDELYTALTEVEAVINSRPLTYVYNDIGEPEALSPANFLTGKRPTSFPTLGLTEVTHTSADQLLQMWKHREEVLDRFWKRWSTEYLLETRNMQRTITSKTHNIKVGDLVLIKDNLLPRQRWQMGTVEDVSIGRDGKIRSGTIRLPGRVFVKRPIQLLFPLEVSTK